MTKHRFPWIKIGVFFLIFILFLTLPLFAQEEGTPWSQYAKAAALFQQKMPSQEIIPLVREVQASTQDPVLFGRVVFLASAAFERENEYDKALLELQKLYEPGRNLPEAMLAESYVRSSLLYLKQHNLRSAKKFFNKALETGSNPFVKQEALLGLAWIAADKDEWEVSDSLLSELTSVDSLQIKDERIVILKARHAMALEKPQEAIELLGDTKSVTGLYFLAKAHEHAGNRIMAVSVYKKLHDLYPSTPEAKQALFQAAEVFMRAGDWLAARSEFKRLLESGLQNADAIHFRLGWINLNLNQLGEALAEFRYTPASENASYFKYMEAECLRRQGAEDITKLNQSIMLFHNIASIDIHSPLAPLAKLKAALTEMEKGDSTVALVSLRQFINLYPKDELSPAVYFLLGVNERPGASQKYFDQIIQQSQKSHFFDVSYFALQNHDFNKGNYQKVITRNASMPQQAVAGELNYWQRANHLLMGESAYFLKHYSQALSEYKLAVNPDNDDLTEKSRIGQAWCKLHLAGPDTALALFERIRKELRGTNKILADYGYATVQFIRQEYLAALKAYPISINTLEFPELKPLVINSLFRSGQSYYRLQYYVQAIETWDRLVREYPDSKLAVESMFNIADIYFRANHFGEADSVYQVLISSYPEDPLAVESALKLAQSAYNAGDYETSVARYQAFIDKYPENEKNKEALEGIQLSYYQMGQIDQASETLKKVIDQTTNSDLAIDARYRIAINNFQEKKYQEAIEAFKEILTLYPNSSYAVDAQFALSKCYVAQEDYKSASEEFLRFIQYFPQSSQLPEAYFLLGVAYYQLESYLSAVDYFAKVVQDYSSSEYYGPALKNSAWCYDRLQEKEKAAQAFTDYLASYPKAEDSQTILLQVARLMLETGKNQDAISRLETLQKSQDPAVSMEASFRLGMYYLENDKSTKAEQAFKQATNPNGGDNYYRLSSLAQLAALYENLGQQQKAISTYELLANSTSEERWTAAAKERIDMLRLQANQENQ